VCRPEFISVAEENGIILPLSDWIVSRAFARIADWNARTVSISLWRQYLAAAA
jgi:EAL domain-containing protein (putative c-di-GMP-specific phosphodiesterase class I)